MAEKKWVENKYSDEEFSNIMSRSSFTRPIVAALAGRNVQADDLDCYCNATLKNLSSPYRIPGTEKASKRIWEAIKNDEDILIHGDFDVDGITASAVLSWILTQNGANVSTFIPHRIDTGYGFTPDSLHLSLSKYKCNLLITVDCGITSNDAVTSANELGIDTIITDHHEQGEKLPDAYTIINTKLSPELSDLHCLAGVGVAFKLGHAFLKYGKEHDLLFHNVDLREILDLVALGTVADIVPLVGENRILTKYGIRLLAKQIRPGIRALCEISGVKDQLKSSDIAFKLAPHINAAGRLGDPNIAYKLLVTESIVDAMQLAQQLREYNLQRRAKEKEIFQEAESQLLEKIKVNETSSILIYGAEWHQGVIGNVASRIARDYNRPSIVLTIINGSAYGSGRSCSSINLVNILSESSKILGRYGGHPMAVGLSLDPKDIKQLSEQFEKSVANVLDVEDLIPRILYDGDIYLSEINDDFFDNLLKLEPFGHSNLQPIYRITNLSVPYKNLAGKEHTRGYVKDSLGYSFPFIAFNLKPDQLPAPPWNILTVPQINKFHNNSSPQLRIIDIKSVSDDIY